MLLQSAEMNELKMSFDIVLIVGSERGPHM